MTPRGVIRVVEYHSEWPDRFCELRARIWPSVCDIATAIEHVGSTAVAGLSAKPVLDLDIVVPTRDDIPLIVTRLARLGYEHRGDLGIVDREAFWTAANHPSHNLYVCPQESVALRNHIAFRDHLRAHPADVVRYSALKKELAERFDRDIDGYVAGKTDFILSILAQRGFSGDHLESIREANRKWIPISVDGGNTGGCGR